MQLVQPSPRDISRAEASRRFGRYKIEEEHGQRSLAVTAEPESLRQRREMLRNLDPVQAMDMIEYHYIRGFFEALALAKKEGKIIVSNDIHDSILTEFVSCNQNYLKSVWTGTCIIYEAPNKPFGEKVRQPLKLGNTTYFASFDVPHKFRGRANCVLVVEHPDFDITRLGENSFELRADEGNMSLLEHFPKGRDGHGYEKKFRIPVEDEKPMDRTTRQIIRNESNYVGPIGRGCNCVNCLDLAFTYILPFNVAQFNNYRPFMVALF